MYLHKEGKIAEYQMAGTVSGFEIWVTQTPGFLEELSLGPGWSGDDWLGDRDEALRAAIDYHETEGCALYLELYPAPEKGEWNWLAQDGDGCWYGYRSQPVAGHNSWAAQDLSSYKLICESPSNPFWRKTLR
jgi:hypothetical protein